MTIALRPDARATAEIESEAKPVSRYRCANSANAVLLRPSVALSTA